MSPSSVAKLQFLLVSCGAVAADGGSLAASAADHLRRALRTYSSLETPGVSECSRQTSKLLNDCSHEKCSNACIGQSDSLFRQWDSCSSAERNSIISAFEQHVWECFDGYMDSQNPYVCSHMAMFAKACEQELTRKFGGVDLVEGSQQCRHVQDGCTGGDTDEATDDEYYIQFPVMLERDRCHAVLSSQGGGPFLDSYAANCSDAALCAAELVQVQTLCATANAAPQVADGVSDDTVSCDEQCKGAIDGLFSSADGGASWALCQGVRVTKSAAYMREAADDFDRSFYYDEYYGGGRNSPHSSSSSSQEGQWSTFGREAVSLYNEYHFRGCGGREYTNGFDSGEQCAREHHKSSLLMTTMMLMLVVAGTTYLVTARADRNGPLGSPELLSASSTNGGTQSAPERLAAARQFNQVSRTALLLSVLTIMTAWACIWMPVGVVGGVTGLVAATISRNNLPHLLAPIGSDGAAPADCCGDVGGEDRTKWLVPVSSLHVTTAVLAGIGALINLLFGWIFVRVGHVADNGFCYYCEHTGKTYCDWPSCFDQCGCGHSEQYSCCTDTPCSSGGECGELCQYGAVALLSVFMLLLLMSASVAGIKATANLRRVWRDANGSTLALGPAIPAVLVQAEPYGAPANVATPISVTPAVGMPIG